ncbi:hypothetical protein [Streptomyces sp. MNU89]|uniref:hypothetical protein n=1 Tax=Streptomyces sp. MNU89 TaxID=2560025 RepID=UPI001E52C33A|nr:hypothetical protein [Streptomyces sp. MNU89]MCC9741315.1 hypothetical protein [Streptomyces sp. MNU89]
MELVVISLVTVATGFIGGRVTVVQTQQAETAPEPEVTVTTTRTVTASPTAPAENVDGGEDGVTDQGEGNSQPREGTETFLADLERVSEKGYVSTSSVKISGSNYPKSVRLGCDDSSGDQMVYDVSGYKRLVATVGIPADSSNAIGSVGSIKVLNARGNQIRETVKVRSSTTTDLQVDITGQDQVLITCALVTSGDPDRRSFTGALGDAKLLA